MDSETVLNTWRRLVPSDWTLQEVADHLGMQRAALAQAIVRARRRGDERAVYHQKYIDLSRRLKEFYVKHPECRGGKSRIT